MKNWNEWLAELISYFRKEYGKLSPEQRLNVSSLENFEFPCQADVLWARNPHLDSHYQVILFTHFEDEEDLSFHIYGAFEPYRFPKVAAEMLSQPKWSKSIPQNEYDFYFTKLAYETYRDYLTGILSGQYHNMKWYYRDKALLVPRNLNILLPNKQLLLQETKDSLWMVWGDLRTIEPSDIVKRTIRDARSRVRSIRQTPESAKQEQGKSARAKRREKPQAFGALMYPPVWIGEVPTQSLKDRIEGKYIPTKTVFSSKYKTSKIVFRQDGFIGICSDDHSDYVHRKEKAMEILNDILATFLVLGLPCHAVREPEIADIRVEPQTLTIAVVTWYSDVHESRFRDADLWGNVLPSALLLNRTTIREDVLPSVVSIAEELTKDEVKRNLLAFLLEAYTLYQNAEYSQSFVASWLVLETHIQKLWKDFLGVKSLSKKRSKKLSDASRWSVDYMLEALNLADTIQLGEYRVLTRLKKLRNGIVHSGGKASKGEAEECFKLAFEITKTFCELEKVEILVDWNVKRFQNL